MSEDMSIYISQADDVKGALWVRDHQQDFLGVNFYERSIDKAKLLMAEKGLSAQQAAVDAALEVGREVHPQVRAKFVAVDPKHRSLTMKRFLGLVAAWARFYFVDDVQYSDTGEEE